MTIDEAELIAWLDGELPPAEAERVAAAVAADPSLAQRADAHRRIAERLRKAFAPLLADPVRVPAVPTSPLTKSNVVDFVRLSASPVTPRRFVMPVWAALAATLAIGLMTGTLIGRGGPNATHTGGHGEVIAQGSLAHALDTQLASRGQASAIQVALTFRTHDGKLCRTWSAAAQSGIACRAGDEWAIKALNPEAHKSGGEYRTAGDNPQLMASVDSMIEGAPLNSAQEAEARTKSWR